MSQFLYKKGSLKNLKKTIYKLDEDAVLQHVYEVTAIAILNYNIDGVGSAKPVPVEVTVEGGGNYTNLNMGGNDFNIFE